MLDPEIYRSVDEHVETCRVVSEDVIRATAYEDAIAVFGKMAHCLVMDFEQGIVAQSVESWLASHISL